MTQRRFNIRRSPKFDPEIAMQQWSSVVNMQMHFNDICMRIRNLFLTAMIAIVGAGGYAAVNDVNVSNSWISFNIAILVPFVGWLAAYLFYLLDFKHYHQYLKAAVLQGEALEDSLLPYVKGCLLYTSPSPRDQRGSRMPSSA